MAKEVYPFSRLNLPRLGDKPIKDLRPLLIPIEVEPVQAAEEKPDPKPSSSATGSATPSENGSNGTATSEQTIIPQAAVAILANAERVSPSVVEDSSLPKTLQLPGEGRLPVELTGQTRLGMPPLTATSSTPSEGNA